MNGCFQLSGYLSLLWTSCHSPVVFFAPEVAPIFAPFIAHRKSSNFRFPLELMQRMRGTFIILSIGLKKLVIYPHWSKEDN